jgi:hypothetical protein
MGRKGYANSKGRASHENFFGTPKVVMAHSNYIRLTSSASKLLNDLGYQFNGYNNGDLTAAFSVMKKRGWASKATLWRALDCLLHYGMIIVTRQGGRNKTTLYALSWRKIDECKGKLDIPETVAAPGTWKEERLQWKSKTGSDENKSLVPKLGQLGTETVPIDLKAVKEWH